MNLRFLVTSPDLECGHYYCRVLNFAAADKVVVFLEVHIAKVQAIAQVGRGVSQPCARWDGDDPRGVPCLLPLGSTDPQPQHGSKPEPILGRPRLCSQEQPVSV